MLLYVNSKDASVVEWSITTDCKSVALRAPMVRIHPDAQNSYSNKIYGSNNRR
jgi:hypothetical protein